ncbi:WD40-repeat-containing domain protein [Globomyces pollinis-pini]|nr:WD40-repeat-containing domain protein [Globomyces pollinis-pini]
MITILNSTSSTDYLSPLTQITAHSNAIFDATWNHDNTMVATASADNSIRLWDIESKKLIASLNGHQGSVKSVSYSDHPGILLSCSRDNSIILWDTRMNSGKKNVMFQIKNAHSLKIPTKKARSKASLGAGDSVTDVKYIYGTNSLLASCGATDGLIKFWDVRYMDKHKKDPVALCNPFSNARRTFGFSSLSCHPTGRKVYVSCLNGCIYEIDGISFMERKSFSHPDFINSSFYIKNAVSSCGDYLASGSKSGDVFVFQIDHHQLPPLLLKGHEEESTGVNWCDTDQKFTSCADDKTVRIWQLQQSPPNTSQRDFRQGFVEEAATVVVSQADQLSTKNATDQKENCSPSTLRVAEEDQNVDTTVQPTTKKIESIRSFFNSPINKVKESSSNVLTPSSSSSSNSSSNAIPRKRPSENIVKVNNSIKRSGSIKDFFKPLNQKQNDS